MRGSKLAVPQIITDPVESAKAVGLRYVTDEQPGIRRAGSAKAFRYFEPDGKIVRDPEQLRRIKSLAIPPAWNEVWICPRAAGHLQATGRDARGRKQYRYHPRWREVRDQTKYNRMIAFGQVLPKIRQKVQRDLALPGLPRDKVLATVVRLLEVSLIRVGNEEYARENHSFGLTTLRDKHVEVNGSRLDFHFRGKSGKIHHVQIDDPRLARVIRKCQDLPGQELFQYLDDDSARQTVRSEDVNEYLRAIAGDDFTAKDFRTWAGTVLAARALQELEQFDSQAMAKKNIVRAVEAVAQMLGNTPSICRKCYVHPAVLESYLDGALVTTLQRRAKEKFASALRELRPEEAAVLSLLQERLLKEAPPRNGFRSRHASAIRSLSRTRKPRGTARSPRAIGGALPAAWRT
jgi:DNA topoisomerase-1